MDIKKLKLLREDTGVSFTLCKKALEASKNNLEAAKKLLNKWGAEKVTQKTDRTTLQGALFSYLHHDRKIVAVVELLCETDFVAKNEAFLQLGQELAMQVASNPADEISVFLEQQYNRDPSLKIKDLIKEAVLKFGENIKIGKLWRWKLGEKNK